MFCRILICVSAMPQCVNAESLKTTVEGCEIIDTDQADWNAPAGRPILVINTDRSAAQIVSCKGSLAVRGCTIAVGISA
jgi:hypothetical protein